MVILLQQQYHLNCDEYSQQNECKEKKRFEQQQKGRQQIKQQQYDNININNSIDPNDDESLEFKHKWKFEMNFDPKMENVIIHISDEITSKSWGITLTKQLWINMSRM